MRVFINNQLVIDSWTRSQEHTVTVDRFIPAGTHEFRVEFFEDGGQATAIFRWELIGSSNAGQQSPNWRGEYFNRPDLSGAPVLIRDDRYINQNWGEASPGPGVNTDFWSARWTRSLVVQPGTYQLNVTSDDGSRVFVNNQLLIDNWIDQTTTRSAQFTSAGNTANVRVEYYDNYGPAFIQLDLIPLGGQTVAPPSTGSCTTAPSGLQAQSIATGPLNVRTGPGTQFEAITTLSPCQIVPLSGFRNGDGTWVQIVLANGQTGWVFTQYVRTGVAVQTLNPI